MKYTVVSISDKRKDNIYNIHSVMSGGGHEFVGDIEFVDGRSVNAFKLLNDFGIRTDVYAPDDGRLEPMTAGEAGCWMSHIRALEFIAKDELSELLVLEDDAIISESFINFLESCFSDLPKDYDFLSFYREDSQNFISIESDIGSNFIHRALAQKSGTVAMLYSINGAKNIFKVARRMGTTYNIDSILYRNSISGFLQGFVVRPDIDNEVGHGEYESMIDPTNFRNG
jgi:GR25 family glycosyltransferase involved in LPS biosynthesis